MHLHVILHLNIEEYFSIDCAWKITEGKAHFGVFYPEQAFLVSKHLNNGLSVISEIRDTGAEDRKLFLIYLRNFHLFAILEHHSYQTVVVVKANHSEGINGLKGKQYCHFGFNEEIAMTLRAKQEFEIGIIDRCRNRDNNVTEREIQLLSNAFSKACRPGRWVEDEEFDRQLSMFFLNSLFLKFKYHKYIQKLLIYNTFF